MIKKISFLLLLLSSCYIYSQDKFSIKGSLVNKENQPLENIVIKLYNENEFKSSISNNKGELWILNYKHHLRLWAISPKQLKKSHKGL